MLTTKKCKACKEEIDAKATKCPKCGTDQRGFFKKHPIITGILVLFFIGLIASAGGSKNSSTTNTDSSTKETATKTEPKAQPTQQAPAKPEIITASVLINDYDKNKLSADEKYKDKLVQTTAYIKNISSDVTGQYYLALNPTNDQYYFGTSLQCFFADKSSLTSLENGQSVTVTGTMDEMSLGIVILKNCSVVK